MSALTAAALLLGSLAAIVTSITIITGAKPVKWLWRRLVHDPAREALMSVVVEVVSPKLDAIKDELSYNGGGSTKDAVRRIEKEVATMRLNLEEDRLRRDSRG